MKKVKFLQFERVRHTKEEKIILGITTIIFIAYSFTLIYPFIWSVFTSFKTQREYKGNIFGAPQEWVFDNIQRAFNTTIGDNDTTLWGMFFNSIWSSFLCSFCGTFISCMTAYVVTKYRFPGSKLFLPIAIILQALPLVGTMPAMFDLVKNLGMYDNPWLFWVVWCGGFGFSFIVLCGYFKGLSWEYAEAAFIDGASHTKVFFKIMVPLAFPAIFSLFLVSFISAWNDYYTMYLYLPSYPTLAVGVYMWKNIAAQNGGTPVYMAALTMSVIPVLILYACFQKTIMSASLGGGIKE
ncbi:MAG: carbohydrate ABC transporter permease [Clostridia bacterium]|nr:carbohydrate ABC transporter permease [Clostridia bacterium]